MPSHKDQKGAIPQLFEESPRQLGIIQYPAQYPSSRSDA
jgi:hypothetical protein